MSEEIEIEEEESPEQETFECPSCGQPQTEFLYHSSRRGWVKCPSCGKYVRKKLIPEKFIKRVSLEEIEPEEAKEEEEEYEEERGRVPFRRPRPAWVILKQILDEFGVKPAAKKIIVARCRRIGELHPTEVQRMLMDLDSGLNHKEAGYVADEYYFALQSEQQETEEYEGMTTYPRWERGGGYGGATYGWSRYETSRTGYPIPPRTYTSRHPWEQPSGVLTEDRLMEILAQRDREFEERLRQRRLEDNLTQLMKQVINLSNEIKNIKENPPSVVPPDVVTKADLERERADSYMKMLERQVDALEKAVEKYEAALKEAESRHEKIVEKIEQRYREEIKELRNKLEDTIRRSSRSIEGYRDDSVRLAADALNRAADILEKKEPVKVIIQGMGKLAEQQEQTTVQPPKEKVGEQTITEQLPPELIEE